MQERSQLARLCRVRGDVRLDVVTSPALRDNVLGDPAERPLPVYLPPGYDDDTRRYPVIYCLHGYTGDAVGMLAVRPWERNVVQWMDALVTGGEMPPAILVLVDGFTRLGGSQYVNSIHNGDYATYVVRDVVDRVDATYRTIAQESGRAVCGKSSGGFGAMHLTMEYPGIFAAFASHSGDACFRYAQMMSFPDVQRTLEGFGLDIASFVAAFEAKPKRPQAWYHTMEMIGYAAAYSPRERKAFAVDLPFDLETGELREDVFGRWLCFDPVERVEGRLAALGRLRLRYLDCGRRDDYGLDIGARILASRMRKAGMSVRHEEFDDDHRNVGYRYGISLPALVGALDKE